MVNARAAIAAVMIVLIFVMDVSWLGRARVACDDPLLEALAAMRCDQDHAIGRVAQLV